MSDGKFKPGQSGNPGGRPKAVKEVIRLALDESPESIRALARIRDEGKDERAVVAACNAILDRGCGKPMQQVKKTVTLTKKSPRDLSLDEIETRLERLRAGNGNGAHH